MYKRQDFTELQKLGAGLFPTETPNSAVEALEAMAAAHDTLRRVVSISRASRAFCNCFAARSFASRKVVLTLSRCFLAKASALSARALALAASSRRCV